MMAVGRKASRALQIIGKSNEPRKSLKFVAKSRRAVSNGNHQRMEVGRLDGGKRAWAQAQEPQMGKVAVGTDDMSQKLQAGTGIA